MLSIGFLFPKTNSAFSQIPRTTPSILDFHPHQIPTLHGLKILFHGLSILRGKLKSLPVGNKFSNGLGVHLLRVRTCCSGIENGQLAESRWFPLGCLALLAIVWHLIAQGWPPLCYNQRMPKYQIPDRLTHVVRPEVAFTLGTREQSMA